MTCCYCGQPTPWKETILCRCGSPFCEWCASGLGEELIEAEDEEYMGEIIRCPRCQTGARKDEEEEEEENIISSRGDATFPR